mgnify:CR=1 FL=1
MMVTHYKTKEEAELNCKDGQSVVMEGNQKPKFRVVDNEMTSKESNYWDSFRWNIDKKAYRGVVY